MDENVPLPITNKLRQRDVDVLRDREDNHQNTPGPIILDRATELQRVVFTQDDDFLAIANSRQVWTRKLQLGQHRDRIINETCLHSLSLLRKILLGEVA